MELKKGGEKSDGSPDGDVLLCRELDPSITKKSPVIRVAKQIANCLHEPKYGLILEVVKVFGASVALDLYRQTARIQEDGGSLTDNGKRRKTPGGVFLTLVKKTGSADQRSRIFYHDKKVKHSNRAQKRKRKKTDERESVKMEQQTEATLHNSNGLLINGSGPLDKIQTELSTCLEDINPPQYFINTGSDIKNLHHDIDQDEIEAAMEFETMDESELNFGIELT